MSSPWTLMCSSQPSARLPDTSWLNGGNIEITKANTFKVEDALNTTLPGVFAAGDAVRGPWTVIGAVAQGNQVAVAVDQWLRTGKLTKPRATRRHVMTSRSSPTWTIMPMPSVQPCSSYRDPARQQLQRWSSA